MQKKKTGSNEELYGELGQAFHFTRGDLEANKAGFISARQKRDLKLRFAQDAIIFASIAIGVTMFALFSTLFPSSSRSGGIQIVAWVIWILGLVLLGVKWRLLLADFREGKVQVFEGMAEEIGVGKSHRKVFVINEIQSEIKLSSEQFRLTNGHGQFRIYLARTSKEVVAIEEIVTEQELSHAEEKE